MSRDELKAKWARLQQSGQTDIRVTIGTANKKTIQKVINALADTMLKFDLSLTWDIEEENIKELCPICGEHISIAGKTKDGRLIGSCGDAFTVQQWEMDK